MQIKFKVEMFLGLKRERLRFCVPTFSYASTPPRRLAPPPLVWSYHKAAYSKMTTKNFRVLLSQVKEFKIISFIYVFGGTS